VSKATLYKLLLPRQAAAHFPRSRTTKCAALAENNAKETEVDSGRAAQISVLRYAAAKIKSGPSPCNSRVGLDLTGYAFRGRRRFPKLGKLYYHIQAR